MNTSLNKQQEDKMSGKRMSSFSIIILFTCLLIVGLFFVPLLPIKLNPSRKLPVVNVSFSMRGQSARVIEMEVTSKLEAMLSRVKGVEGINSYSKNGSGSITVRLNQHVNPEIARFEISTIIRQTWVSLPQGVSYPYIQMSGTSEDASQPFIRYTINAPTSPIAIQKFAENTIKTKLSEIKGIDRIEITGASQMIHKLEYDYEQLKNLGVSVGEIQTSINQYLQKEFLGIAKMEDVQQGENWIRIALVPQQTGDTFNCAAIQVKNKDGKILYLDQLVKASFEEEESSSSFRINGLNSIYMSIVADDAANQLNLSNQVKESLSKMEESFPPGFELHLSYNAGDYIEKELNKIYIRSGLTVLILLLFVLLIYRNLKYSFLIIFSLIANISIAAIFYYFIGIEMQLFSLAGLTISLTLLIDNAIVMSDQIIQRGNNKAFLAILTATLTTISALVIIFFMDEKVRLNLQDFAFIIIINLTISLLIAIFLVPALIEKLNIRKRSQRKRRSRFEKFVPNALKKYFKKDRAVIYIYRFYEKIIVFTSKRKVLLFIFVILAFGLPVFMLPDKLENKTKDEMGIRTNQELSFWQDLYNSTFGSTFYKETIKPVSDAALGGTLRLFTEKVRNGSYSSAERSETTLNVAASLPNGTTKEQMNVLIQKMENYIGQYSEVRQFETSIYDARRASITIYFTEDKQRGSFPHMLKSKLISKALELGGGSWSVYGLGDGFNNDVKEQAGASRIKLLGYNYDDLNALSLSLKDSLLEHRRIQEIAINSEFSWFKSDYMEYVFDLKKERLAQENILPMNLFNSLRPMFDKNLWAGTWTGKEGMEQIHLFSKQAQELDIWNLDNYPGPLGDKMYKLSEIADIVKNQVPQDIAKENQQYRLCMQYEYIGSYQQANNVLERSIEKFNTNAPLGYSAKQDSSNYWWDKSSGASQYWLLLLIIVIMFFTTSILFNSLKQPLIVIFIIPISYIGVFLTFYLFDLNFDQGGFAAFILLSGITVNANVYILNEFNNIRKKTNISPLRAYIKAWNAKIRPIFLTVISTILGFIPFMVGDYKESFWFPLAAGTIGGLVVSLIALFLFLPLCMGVGRKKSLKV